MTSASAASPGVFVWDDYFETGLGEVDEQHFKLVSLVNQLGERLASGRPLSDAEREHVLGGLHRYAMLHFRTEEDMMIECGLDPRHIDEHRRAHGDFIIAVEQLAAETSTNQLKLLSELLHYVSSWLALHILGIDMAMSRQVDAIANGVSAAEAYERDAHSADPANRALVSAVHTLYATVAQRNAELLKAKAELEDRVAERTRDLQEAVLHLEAAREEIVQSEKMAALGQFAAGMAHELNTPLGFIGGNLNALGDYCNKLVALSAEADKLVADGPPRAAWRAACEHADRDFVREDAPQLLAESRSGLDRIHRIVDALKRSAGSADDVHVNTALKDIVDSVLQTYRSTVPDNVSFECACNPAHIANVSVHAISVAVDELMDNAVKALAGTGGVIRCSTGSNSTQIWIEIADTGPGISAAIAPHIFEPFFTTRAVGSGAGLGLYLAYQTAREHHGFIELRKSSRGAVFRLVLPKAEA